jgi:GT2 family glycosyltransferase
LDRLAVVILNWNGMGHLETFLPSVVKYSSLAKVYIADNASTDQSIPFIKANFPEVRIIQNQANKGYSNGYNQALKKIKAHFYVLLNSDVEVTENWLEPIIQHMEEHPEIAACQPKIRSFTHKHQFEYAGAAGGFIDRDGYMFCRGRMFDAFEEDTGQYDGISEIFWATGAALFIRGELFHKAGGLDEDFFAHMEEIDLCWRLKNMGYKIYYNSNSTVYHLGGGTLSRINPRKTYLNFRNNLYLLTKNYNQGYFLLKLLYRMVLDGLAALKFLIDLHPRHSFAVLRAHASYYRHAPIFFRKRKQNLKGFKKTGISGIYKKSVVFDYFLFKKRKFSELDISNFS